MAVGLFKWLTASLVLLLHPFFVSVTEVQHNAADKTLEISVKIFIDDFEKTLTQASGSPVDLSNPKDPAKAGQLVFDYLRRHLKLKVNGQPVSLEWVGYEKEKEAAWCYLQVNGVPQVQKVEIDNTLLYDAFDKQINIMHVVVNGNRKSTKVAYPDAQVAFSF